MDEDKIEVLKQFISHCKSNPALLHNTALGFFKSYLVSLGARIPAQPKKEVGGDKMSDTKEHVDAEKPSPAIEEDETKKAERERQRKAAMVELKDGEVIKIETTDELNKKLDAAKRTSRLLILYFTATWSGPCRTISPYYTSEAEKRREVVFLKADIDNARDLAADRSITTIPTLFFFKNGEEVDKIVGGDKDALEKKIAEYAG